MPRLEAAAGLEGSVLGGDVFGGEDFGADVLLGTTEGAVVEGRGLGFLDAGFGVFEC